jgi:hypothetical protein
MVRDQANNGAFKAMKMRNVFLAAASLILAAAGIFAEEAKTKMAIAVVDADSHGEVRIELDSDDVGFNLHDMQEGENRSIVDESGRTILITREADGIRFDVEGKTVNVPLFDGKHHGAIWVVDGDMSDLDVHVMEDTTIETAHAMDDVMIVSEKPIDDATRQAIKSMLESAGYGSEIRFIDADDAHGGVHGIKVIEKKVEVTR